MLNQFVRGIKQPQVSHAAIYHFRRQISSKINDSFVPYDLQDTLDKLDSDYRNNPNGNIDVKICNLCDKGNKTNLDNLYKLSIFKNGNFHCFRCSKGGNYKQLKSSLNGGENSNSILNESSTKNNYRQPTSRKYEMSSLSSPSKDKQYVLPDQSDSYMFTKQLFPSGYAADDAEFGMKSNCIMPTISFDPKSKLNETDVKNENAAFQVRDYLRHTRMLSLSMCEKYGVGMSKQSFPASGRDGKWVEEVCITFPWIDSKPISVNTGDIGEEECETFEIVRIKHRAMLTKGKQRMMPSGGQWGFFGWHLVSPSAATPDSSASGGDKHNSHHGNAIVITEGEYDTIAVAEAIEHFCTSNRTSEYCQELKSLPVVSLPNGCGSLPDDLLPQLEPFTKIYLWLDFDSAGIAAAASFAKKLGIHRCCIVKPSPHPSEMKLVEETLRMKNINPESLDLVERFSSRFLKDANDYIRNGMIISSTSPGSGNEKLDSAKKIFNDAVYSRNVSIMVDMLMNAEAIRHEKLLTFSDMKQEVLQSFRRMAKSPYEGTISKSLPTLTAYTKGFRRGELVVFTGPTGSGKTTLLSQLSLDFAMQGVPTLWGSFEIKNVRLLQKMLHQYYGSIRGVDNVAPGPPPATFNSSGLISAASLTSNVTFSPTAPCTESGTSLGKLDHEKLGLIADDFEQLPFHFLNFHGGSNLQDVLDAMEYSVLKHNIQHIILDNLQFMMPATSNGRNSNFDKFEVQDGAIEAFRKFATSKNVNIILVIHPRKEDDRMALGMSSIFGSAKATQEADMVIILQKPSTDGLPTDGKLSNGYGPAGNFQNSNPNAMHNRYGSVGVGHLPVGVGNQIAPPLTYLEVKKNRYDGTTGKINLKFSKDSSMYYE